jgi:hypothetical protein
MAIKTQAQIATSLSNWQSAFGTLLTKLDSDAGVTQTSFAADAALVSPKEPYECARKFNLLCAMLDKDAAVLDQNYRKKCSIDFQRDQHLDYIDQVDALHRHLGMLVGKLNEDLGVTDIDYVL